MSEDTRYPYTYACDFVRCLAGHKDESIGTKISRCDASKIREGIAKALGMSDEELAKKLADYYKAHEKEIVNEEFQKLSDFLASNHNELCKLSAPIIST
jgi:hypothetical protein